MSHRAPRHKRTDANQAEIVRALRAVGASVEVSSNVGSGYPDLTVGFRGATFLVEVKQHRQPGMQKHQYGLNKDQRDWHARWRGHCTVARDVDEALRVIGALRSPRPVAE